jgi:hypothetical protein
MSSRVRRAVRTLVAVSLLTSVVGAGTASSLPPTQSTSTFESLKPRLTVVYGLQPATPGVASVEDC